MTGPEHYKIAENLLNRVASDDTRRLSHESRVELAARAQVHATLAVAAATATSGRMVQKNSVAWDNAVQPEAVR